MLHRTILHKLLWYGLPAFRDFLLDWRHRDISDLLRRAILHKLLWNDLSCFRGFLLEQA